MKNVRRHLWPFGIIIAALTVFYRKQIFGGEVFYCCDNLLLNIPAKEYFVSEIRSGRYPLWNPFILSGTPFFADLNLAILYPLNILYFFLDPFIATTLVVIISVIASAIGMYMCLRLLGLTRSVATMCGLLWATSGTMVVYSGNLPMTQTASLLPWVMAGWIYDTRAASRRSFVILSSLITVQAISGHPQLTYYSLLMGICYMAIVGSQHIFLKGIRICIIGAFVALLGAVQFLPFIELVTLSTRTGRDYTYATFDSLHPLSLIRFILPQALGDATRGSAWLQGGSRYGYVGVLPLFLLFFAPRSRRTVLFFLGVLGCSLFLAFGKYTPVFSVAYRFLPGLGSFRGPHHFLLLYTFSVVVLAGFGITELVRVVELRWRAVKTLLIAGACASVLGTIVLRTNVVPTFYEYVPRVAPISVVRKVTLTASEFNEIGEMAGQNLLITSGVLLGAATLMVILSYARLFSLFGFGVVCLIELFLFSPQNFIRATKTQVHEWLTFTSEAAHAVEPIDKFQERLFVHPETYQSPREKRFGLANYHEETIWQAKILRPNLPMLFGLSTMDGYASLILRSYQRAVSDRGSDPTGIRVNVSNTTLLKKMGVSTIIAPESAASQLIRDGYELHNPLRDGLYIYKNNGEVRPRISSSSSKAHIQNISYSSDAVSIIVDSPEVHDLLFTDTMYPGWYVKIDDVTENLRPFEFGKSVRVPGGSHTVQFIFNPQSFRLGLLLSALGASIAIILWRQGNNKRKQHLEAQKSKRKPQLSSGS